MNNFKKIKIAIIIILLVFSVVLYSNEKIGGLKENYNQPLLVMTYDDGFVGMYEEIFPVHEKYDVPGSFGPVTAGIKANQEYVESRIGTTYIQPEQIEEMYEAGMEFVSHGYRHLEMTEYELKEDIKIGYKSIVLKEGGYRGAGKSQLIEDFPELKIVGKKSSEIIKIIREEKEFPGGAGESPGKLYLEEAVGNDYPAGTEVRLTEKEIEKEFYKTKQFFDKMDIPIKYHLWAYNSASSYKQEKLGDYYQAARGGGTGVNIPPYNFEYLEGLNIDDAGKGASDKQILDFLDKLKEEKALGFTFSHPGHYLKDEGIHVTPERIEFVIEETLKRNIEIVSFKEAMKKSIK